jgi:hypothetical protein
MDTAETQANLFVKQGWRGMNGDTVKSLLTNLTSVARVIETHHVQAVRQAAAHYESLGGNPKDIYGLAQMKAPEPERPITPPKASSKAAPTQSDKDYLHRHPEIKARFDKQFGAGSAERILQEGGATGHGSSGGFPAGQ